MLHNIYNLKATTSMKQALAYLKKRQTTNLIILDMDILIRLKNLFPLLDWSIGHSA